MLCWSEMQSPLHLRRRAVALLVGTLAALPCAPAAAQAAGDPGRLVDVPGVVVDVQSGEGIADVILRVAGTDVSAATDRSGRFVLRGVPRGTWTLRVEHLAYGAHEHELAVSSDRPGEIRIRLAQEAIELEPLLVESETRRQRAERAQGSSLHVVERAQIERALGTSRHLGDLLRQTVPGLRMRQSNNLVGNEVCLEFRGAATMSLVERRPCSHPMVLLDGVPVANPHHLYGSVGLSTIERIQMIPPGEAGARYGTGSLYGVLLIETRTPGLPRSLREPRGGPLDLRARATFDWTEDPDGHDLFRTVAGAFLGNAVGLAAGIALGRQCVGVDARDQIVMECGDLASTGAILGAIALPAFGGALGARWGGATDHSVGRLLPAMLGAGMMLFPGYAFSMSTVGGGSEAANTVGAAFLVIGTPVVITMADHLFRRLR